MVPSLVRPKLIYYFVSLQISHGIGLNILAFIPTVILGIIGGLLGAVFTFINLKVQCVRMIMGDSRKYPYHTTDGFKDFRRGGGIHDYGILKAWGGIYDLKSEGMGEFHRWDFWSRKCRVSSWKTLLLWTFVVRK